MKERLKQIEARVKKLGWDMTQFREAVDKIVCCVHNFSLTPHVILSDAAFQEIGIPEAERILSLYEDGATYPIYGRDPSQESCAGCNRKQQEGDTPPYCNLWLAQDLETMDGWDMQPGPYCIGEGKFKIVRWEDGP